MAPEEDRHGWNKLILTITLAVIFVIKMFAFSQLYRLPNISTKSYKNIKSVFIRNVTLQYQILLGDLDFTLSGNQNYYGFSQS